MAKIQQIWSHWIEKALDQNRKVITLKYNFLFLQYQQHPDLDTWIRPWPDRSHIPYLNWMNQLVPHLQWAVNAVRGAHQLTVMTGTGAAAVTAIFWFFFWHLNGDFFGSTIFRIFFIVVIADRNGLALRKQIFRKRKLRFKIKRFFKQAKLPRS